MNVLNDVILKAQNDRVKLNNKKTRNEFASWLFGLEKKYAWMAIKQLSMENLMNLAEVEGYEEIREDLFNLSQNLEASKLVKEEYNEAIRDTNLKLWS